MSEICPNCNGAGGDNNTWICGTCNGSGGVPRPQPSAEPVAYLYEREGCKPYVTANRQQQWVESGSTEEALVRASALEAARREALEQNDPFAWADGVAWHKSAHRAVMASVKLGAWLSAALDDPAVCEAMKADIREWFSAGEPMETLCQALAALKENTNG